MTSRYTIDKLDKLDILISLNLLDISVDKVNIYI